MKVLVTGGAGFIGRWVVKKLLSKGVNVWVLDDLSNGSKRNLNEFVNNGNYHGLTVADVSDGHCFEVLPESNHDIYIHLAAQINVQESLINPAKSFRTNIIGTYNLLHHALKRNTRIVIVGTCMVYDTTQQEAISEHSPVRPASPYAGTKLAAENLALSYYHGLGLPITVLRPFNTYGPFQKTNTEGGVISIFIKTKSRGRKYKYSATEPRPGTLST